MKQISILLPSRKRMDTLKKCINNLIDKADDPRSLEILIRLDNDDIETIQRLGELPYDKIDIFIIIGNRFGGYADLHLYVNELCAISRGTFLFLYNDDATICTKGWDSIVKKHKIVALNPIADVDGKKKYDLFPIVHRKIYETLGFFSRSPHNDSWMFELTKTAKLEKKLPELKIYHYRNKMKDETHRERTSQLPISGKKHQCALGEEMTKAKEKIEKAKTQWR